MRTLLLLLSSFILCAGLYNIYSPAAKACHEKGGRYSLTGCWKITMIKLSD